MTETKNPPFFPYNEKEVVSSLGKDKLLEALQQMLLIRHFELRAENAYQQGKMGGFFHSYVGQEAIQTAAILALGKENWFSTSYRCHALALLLGATPKELMAELFGKANGNAKGRGGSMHFYEKRLLGGFGIVGGQIPIGAGAGFSIKYKEIKNEVSLCFLGDGAVAQGAFHESLNLAALWKLPCIFVIENNQWGMGTGIERAISVSRLAEDKAGGYGMKGYTFDGMDFFSCYNGFKTVYEEVLKTSMPVLVEVITERFKGHSISDPGLYRSKEALSECMKKDPLLFLKEKLKTLNFITDEEYETLSEKEKEVVMNSLDYAEKSPWPSPLTLEEDVYA